MKLNLKKRFTNKTFVASFIAVVILLVQQLGLGQYLPNNLMDIVNTILILLSMLGIIVDPTTNGVTDSQAVLENKTSDELLEEIKELKEKLEK
jgi:phi LC3 family holin